MTAQDVLDRTNGLHVEATAHERSFARQGIENPTLEQLLRQVERRGPEGVLESGTHLSDAEWHKLVKACKAATPKRTKRGRR